MVWDVGLTEIEKSEFGGITSSVRASVWVSVVGTPLGSTVGAVPVSVSAKDPVGVCVVVRTSIVALPPGFTCTGVIVALACAGRPLTLKVTAVEQTRNGFTCS